jgi:hypothetical protein
MVVTGRYVDERSAFKSDAQFPQRVIRVASAPPDTRGMSAVL